MARNQHNFTAEFLAVILNAGCKFYGWTALNDVEAEGVVGDKIAYGSWTTQIGTVVHVHPIMINVKGTIDLISCGGIAVTYFNSNVNAVIESERAWGSLKEAAD